MTLSNTRWPYLELDLKVGGNVDHEVDREAAAADDLVAAGGVHHLPLHVGEGRRYLRRKHLQKNTTKTR